MGDYEPPLFATKHPDEVPCPRCGEGTWPWGAYCEKCHMQFPAEFISNWDRRWNRNCYFGCFRIAGGCLFIIAIIIGLIIVWPLLIRLADSLPLPVP